MIKKNHPMVLAHRGASGYAPENTLASFRKGMELGADGFELDIQLTKDGEIVVIHDEWLERVSDGKGFVKDYTFEELRQLNFNKTFPEYGPQQIPTLREVYELIKDTDLVVDVELKTGIINYPNLVEKALKLAEETGMKDRVFYSSFNHYTCMEIKKQDPDAYVGFLYGDVFIDVEQYVKDHGGDAIHPAFYLLQDPIHARKAKELGLEINTWTVNELEHMKMCLMLGVDTIITNYPDRALNLLKEQGLR